MRFLVTLTLVPGPITYTVCQLYGNRAYRTSFLGFFLMGETQIFWEIDADTIEKHITKLGLTTSKIAADTIEVLRFGTQSGRIAAGKRNVSINSSVPPHCSNHVGRTSEGRPPRW